MTSTRSAKARPLPVPVVAPLGGLKVDALRDEANARSLRWLHADCAGARGKTAIMLALGRGFGLPAHYGGNLDALYDCLTDLEPLPDAPEPGLLIVLENIREARGFDAEQIESLLDVFRDAGDHFRDRGVGFRAYYSLSAPGGPAPR